MSDCLFCKMVSGEIQADALYETDDVLAFRDISPQAPFHALVIPKRHIATLNDVVPEDAVLMGELFLAAAHIAKEADIDAAGYRSVLNCNAGAGQTVFHLHLHVLGGRGMTWPPG
ncbi:MAG: histidine triad nucleotide-binding protein [Gammaproteobacteria bacterium]|nr:histidine triad nucleotide-binding protein [Gammaproteobacteria bacterium]